MRDTCLLINPGMQLWMVYIFCYRN